MKPQIAAHLFLALLAAVVIPDDYVTEMNFHQIPEIIPTGVRALYACSFAYHLGCYFVEIYKRKDWVIWVLIGCMVPMCLCERFLVVTVICWYLVFWPFLYDVCKYRKMDMMRVHHVLTIALILLSWMHHYVIIGSLLMFVNDVTDVPMFLLRRLRAREEHPSCKQVVLAVFVWVMWIFYRVIGMGVIFAHVCHLWRTHMILRFEIVECLVQIIQLLAVAVLWGFNVFWVSLLSRKLSLAVVEKLWDNIC